MEAIKSRKTLQSVLAFLWGLTVLGFIDFLNLMKEQGWLDVSRKLQILRIAGWAAPGLMGLFVVYLLLNKDFAEKLWIKLNGTIEAAAKFRWLALIIVVLFLPVYPLLVFGSFAVYVDATWTRLALFAWLVLGQSLALAVWRQKDWLTGLAFSATVLGVVYHFTTYLPHISNYPFGLWWSEVSRYYLASTFFDKRIYGVDTPWVFRDTTRYLMQAVPFLFSGLPLWAHRLWQVLLRFGTPYLTAWIFARRLKLPKRTIETAIFIFGTGLFLFVGPVFYNLLVILMLSLWLIDADRYTRTLLAVAGITVWAGLSRINWVPMPALIAVTFYLLDKPYPGKGWKALWGYFWQPVSWVAAGLGVGLLTQSWYAANSGNIEGVATTSFTSDLIWQRLFPNPSYSLGILLSVLLVSLPLLVYMTLGIFRGKQAGFYWLRLLGIIAIVGVLFAGGLIVSVKIGGGTNLHNMDTYLVAVLLVGVCLYYGKAADKDGVKFSVQPPTWLIAGLVAAPVVFVALFGGRSTQPLSDEIAQQDLETLNAYVQDALADGGEVLFISQRHLITFGYIKDVPLVYEYEKMELMDNVMAGTPAYLEAFGADMSSQRFALIIQDPLPTVWKNPEKQSLAAENNVYLQRAVPLITCAYEEAARLADKSIQVMVPLEVPTCGQAEE